MTSFLAVILLGFFLGMRHATDADHVIAVTTILSRQRTTAGAAVIGALWGVGHTLTILAVGAGIVLLGWVIPPRVGLSLELSVGVMLIVLGLMNLSGVLQRVTEAVTPPAPAGGEVHPHINVHAHAHAHGDYVHSHLHGHQPEAHPHRPEETPLARIDRLSGPVGTLPGGQAADRGDGARTGGVGRRGAAGPTTIGNSAWSVVYLLVFGVGTIAGMMLITAGLAWPLTGAMGRFAWLPRRLRLASGLISLVAGLAIAYQIGVVDGIFSASPTWTPH